MGNFGGTVTLTNSTISGNSADDTGGGVVNVYSTATLSRTLIAGNTADLDGAEVYNVPGGTITADNFNLFGHDGVSEAAAFAGFLPGATDINATTGCTTTICTPTALSAILDPLALNAPGTTETHALPVGSPAIDASPVDTDCLATDQRGVARPQGAACDIGAFEFESGAAIISGGTEDSPAPASLVQDAINAASAGDTIEVSGFFLGCIVVNRGRWVFRQILF